MLIDQYVQEIADELGIKLTNETFIMMRQKIAEYVIAAHNDIELISESMIIAGNFDWRNNE
jgi:hypothetical protein